MIMDHIIDHNERKDKRKGYTASILAGIAVIILLFLPLLRYPIPPPGQEGILVNLGLPDIGQGNSNAGPTVPVDDVVEEVEEETAPPEELSEPEPPQPTQAPPTEDRPEEVLTDERSNEPAISEQERAEQEARQRREQEAEERRRQEEAERKRQEAEARKRAEEEARKQAEAEKMKENIGGLFGKDEGKGNTGQAGNQGDPGGDPDASKLEGISTGSGQVGGGLSGRGVTASPRVTDRSQDQGVVVVRVCVDRSGNVLSAEFTQRGSTATSARLKSLAVSNARKWKFSPGNVDKQCGTITYNFKVR